MRDTRRVRSEKYIQESGAAAGLLVNVSIDI
jgi:hypothetical protein